MSPFAGSPAGNLPLGLEVLLLHGLLHALRGIFAAPRLSKRRIDERQAHELAWEAVFLHGVRKLDAVLALSLDEHVGKADGMRFRVDLLTVQIDRRIGAHLGELLLGAGNHPARSAGEIPHIDVLARFG
ncbi:MAG: hypothetical protein IJ087_12105 [Eggerthellaceae bacterium]|nr:hypothetical protein [Eggerthellaceae bacterium]